MSWTPRLGISVRRELSRREPSLRNLMVQTVGHGEPRAARCKGACVAMPSWMTAMDATDPPPRRGALIALLLLLALLLTLGAAVAIWLDRQALSNPGWSDTSERVLENPQVRTAVGAEIVTQLFQQGHVDQRLQSAVGPLSGVAAGELHKLATRLSVTALGTP